MDEDKSKNIFLNINSTYILKQILDNLYENKLLNIIRYNKFLQNNFIIIPFKQEKFFHIYFNDNE